MVRNRVHTGQDPCPPTHRHFIILIFTAHLSYAATCGPCESPWTLRSWPVKPLNGFHMFCTCRAGLHMPLCHTSRYPTLSTESQIQTVWPLIIPGPGFFRSSWSSFWRRRLPSALVLACNTYPCLTLSRQPHGHRPFSGVSMRTKLVDGPETSCFFAHDVFVLDSRQWHCGNVQYMEFVSYVPFFSHLHRGFVKTSPCEPSQMSLTRVLLEGWSHSCG